MQQHPYQQGNEPVGSIFDEEQAEVPAQQPAAGPSPYLQDGPAQEGPPPVKNTQRSKVKKTARAPRQKRE